ncbi:MAG: hypothetical protein ACPG45_04145 [Flavobacteriaceae bacterium]
MPLFKLGYLILLFLMSMAVIYNYLILNEVVLAYKEVIILLVFYTFALIYWYKISKYIEYDSNGSGIVLITKGILLSEFVNHREHRVELPKEKLVNYKVIDCFFYKKLKLYIKSKHKIKKVRMDITFLSATKTKALKLSLDKIVRENS